MNVTDLLLGGSLAIDALLASVALVLEQDTRIKWYWLLSIALVFGGFQVIMPILGMLLSVSLMNYIDSVDHWIAFLLLVGVGGSALYHVFQNNPEKPSPYRLHWWTILSLAIATSIDALAVGFTLPTISKHITVTLSSIGIITVLLSLLGMLFAEHVPDHWHKPLKISVGLVLIGLGLKIVIEHLFY